MPSTEEEERINSWRIERFRELGYTETAAQLAASLKLDPHEVKALIDRGCPLGTALQIVR